MFLFGLVWFTEQKVEFRVYIFFFLQLLAFRFAHKAL